jgi:chloride channel 3/4/5
VRLDYLFVCFREAEESFDEKAISLLSKRILIGRLQSSRLSALSFKTTRDLGIKCEHANLPTILRCIIMASASVGYFSPAEQASSSSSQSPPKHATVDDDRDNDDPIANFSRDQALLADDPLEAENEEIVSFKRKLKPTAGSRFLSVISGGSNVRQSTPSPRTGTPTLNTRSHGLNVIGGSRDGANNTDTKDGGPLDWYVEGPGRRVGYEDMTAIDWIFEYTKERQRLRMLYSHATGLLGYAQQFLDASQVWVVLILTGLAAGVFAASIDVVSDWLGDLKTGYCSAGKDGGHFYLNRYFCCYGYDSMSQCQGWVPWAKALNISASGGTWFSEYIFFIVFSVCSQIKIKSCSNDHLQVLFAITASVLVQEYAPYAKHSGIPEIKTVLGGFVIRRFMGTWTLVIKSLGLVRSFIISFRTRMLTYYSVLQWHLECGWEKKVHWFMLHVAVRICS